MEDTSLDKTFKFESLGRVKFPRISSTDFGALKETSTVRPLNQADNRSPTIGDDKDLRRKNYQEFPWSFFNLQGT